MGKGDRLILYHGVLTDNIYVGEISKQRKNTVNWKKDVTSDFLRCITEFLPNKATVIESTGGKSFLVTCKKITKKEHNEWKRKAVKK